MRGDAVVSSELQSVIFARATRGSIISVPGFMSHTYVIPHLFSKKPTPLHDVKCTTQRLSKMPIRTYAFIFYVYL